MKFNLELSMFKTFKCKAKQPFYFLNNSRRPKGAIPSPEPNSELESGNPNGAAPTGPIYKS